MEERLNRLSNIKATGWTTLIIFGLLTYWVIAQIIGTVVFMNNSMTELTTERDEMKEVIAGMNRTATLLRTIWILVGGLSLLASIGAIGLIKLKNWGLILFHSTTIIIILGIVFGVGYYIITAQLTNGLNSTDAFDIAMTQHFRNTQKYLTISYGTFLLLIAWIITRTNILLAKKSYRMEFR